jgi:UDP-glucose 4-epimerase
MFEDVHKAHGISVVCFRYFNVAGAWDDVGDHLNAGHIVSRLCENVHHGHHFTLNGDNMNTYDGSCIRDYLHVRDVADAHLHAANFLDAVPGYHTFNLGTGTGRSNLEMIKAFERFAGHKVKYNIGPPRPGDPAFLVAGADKFVNQTGYRYNHSSLENIITTAWDYYCNKMEKMNAY